MKIVYFLGSFYPAQCGGPNNTIFWQAKELVRNGVDVTVVTTDFGLSKEHIKQYSIDIDGLSDIDGVKVYFCKSYRSSVLSYKVILKFYKMLKDSSFVNITSFFYLPSMVAALCSRVKNIPFTFSPRGELEPNALVYNWPQKRIYMAIFQRVFNKSDFVMVTSEQERDFVKKHFVGKPIEVVPNYLPMGGWNRIERVDLDLRVGVLYLGRLHPKKAIEKLIEAYSNLADVVREKHPLIIAGIGENSYVLSLQKLCEKLEVSDHVSFLGEVVGEEKEKLYHSSKVLVLPSYSENFGNVVVEALRNSLPVIASKHTPWQRLIQVGAGYWIDNDIRSIEESLVDIDRMDGDKYYRMSKKAFELAQNEYSLEKNIQKLISIYQKYMHT